MGNRGSGPFCGRCAGVPAWLDVAVCAAIMLLGQLLASGGQSSVDGAIGGRVTDWRGDSVVAARVSVVSEATGFEQVLKTGADGSFLLTHAAPGTYRVAISATGFEVASEPVTVVLGAIATADARLRLATVETLISVDSAPIPVVAGSQPGSPEDEESTQPATVSGFLATASQLDLLPMDGRRWQSFALLLPETGGGSASDGGAVGELSRAGDDAELQRDRWCRRTISLSAASRRAQAAAQGAKPRKKETAERRRGSVVMARVRCMVATPGRRTRFSQGAVAGVSSETPGAIRHWTATRWRRGDNCLEERHERAPRKRLLSREGTAPGARRIRSR